MAIIALGFDIHGNGRVRTCASGTRVLSRGSANLCILFGEGTSTHELAEATESWEEAHYKFALDTRNRFDEIIATIEI